mmetsp:Transcript_17435/g.29798  ORF Transcript_17435/g.29798 Transcript_17435/m.29798 type:complete len:247 (+) Transcript_17435:89-829(+)
MGLKSLTGKLIGLAMFLTALLRVELAVGFGKGTGVNRIHISPLSVTMHFCMQNIHRLPPQIQPYGQKVLTALAVPGELAIEHGIIAAPKVKKSKKKKAPKPNPSLEGRAIQYCKDMKNDKAYKKLLDENTFAIAGGIMTLVFMIATFFMPYEGFQNTLLGLGCFWFGANGAHGSNVEFTIPFYVICGVLVLALFFLAEPSKKDEKKKKKKEKKKVPAKSVEEEWDDGIGGVSMEEVRKRGKKDGCC